MTGPLPYLAAVAIVVGALVGTYSYGVSVGRDREVATQARIDQANQATREAAQQGAAEAISKIKITNTTIRGEVQREVQTNTIYRDCKLPADGLRIANDALQGQRTKPAGSGQLPAPVTDGR